MIRVNRYTIQRLRNILMFLKYAVINDFTQLLKFLLLRTKIIKSAQFKFTNSEVFIPYTDSVTFYHITSLLMNKCNITSNQIKLNNGLVFNYLPSDFSLLSHINATFFQEEYKLIDVKDKVVLDIGASFGDTAIYFAMSGAKKIYAYEPLKEIYDLLVLNIKINNFSDVIIPYNKAVSSKKGKVYINPVKNWSGGSSTKLEKNGEGYWVNTEPIRLDVDVLKMDCEGCEYDVFSNIKSLDCKEIIMEYHKGRKL